MCTCEHEPAPPLNLTIPEAAKLLACSRDHVYTLMSTGELPWVQLGISRSMKRIRYADVVKLNKSRTFGV